MTNTGDRAGYEVVQLYIGDDDCSMIRPAKELKAFQKVWLEPGETKTVTLELDRMSLAFFDDRVMQWVAEAGSFTLYVGAASNDIRLTRQINWLGDAGSQARFNIYCKVGDLLAHPEAKAVLAKYLGDIVDRPHINAMRNEPVIRMAPYLPHSVNPDVLQKINAALIAMG